MRSTSKTASAAASTWSTAIRGFIRNEVHRPEADEARPREGTWTEDPTAQGYYEVKTWWRNFADFVRLDAEPRLRGSALEPAAEGDVRRPERLEVHEILTSTDLPRDGK
jgi:hypothetical protein